MYKYVSMLRLLAGWLASTQSLVRRATLKMADAAPSPKRSRLEEDRVSEVQELVLQSEKQSSECEGVAEDVRSKDVGVAEEDGGVAKVNKVGMLHRYHDTIDAE